MYVSVGDHLKFPVVFRNEFFFAMCGECVYRKTALERSVNMSFERVNVFWGGDEVSFLYTRF